MAKGGRWNRLARALPTAMPDAPLPLLPTPRALRRGGESFRPAGGVLRVDPHPAVAPALRRLGGALATAGIVLREDAEHPDLALAVDPTAVAGEEAYRLTITPAGVTIVGGGEAGLAHGVHTLAQVVAVSHGNGPGPLALPGLVIDDAPHFPERGVMLDVSRDRVPTMATLFALVDLYASWKINRLQLYTEHTFAYRGCEEVWSGFDPLTGEEVEELDAYCAARHVELVPNQQCFGHLHHWLVQDRFRDLAECPDGVEHPFSSAREPFSLCPTDPAGLAFVDGLLGELLPRFRSRTVNVGCDETFDLGEGRSAAACAARGKGRVYLEFLQGLHRLAAGHGRRMQFWADVILHHPELVEELPRDAVPMLWGYAADHPFPAECAALAASGLAFHVCPGTSGWQSLGGRTANMWGNVTAAVAAARTHGARGILLTDWGDRGHLQPLPVSFPGQGLAAARSWNPDGGPADPAALGELLAHHAFDDPTGASGALLLSLGRTGEVVGAVSVNASPLSLCLTAPEPPFPPAELTELTPAGLEAAEAHALGLVPALAAFPSRTPDPVLRRELVWAARLLAWAAQLGRIRLAAGGSVPLGELRSPARRSLGDALRPLVEEHRALWPLRSRPGGLARSAGWLERLENGLHGPP